MCPELRAALPGQVTRPWPGTPLWPCAKSRGWLAVPTPPHEAPRLPPTPAGSARPWQGTWPASAGLPVTPYCPLPRGPGILEALQLPKGPRVSQAPRLGPADSRQGPPAWLPQTPSPRAPVSTHGSRVHPRLGPHGWRPALAPDPARPREGRTSLLTDCPSGWDHGAGGLLIPMGEGAEMRCLCQCPGHGNHPPQTGRLRRAANTVCRFWRPELEVRAPHPSVTPSSLCLSSLLRRARVRPLTLTLIQDYLF